MEWGILAIGLIFIVISYIVVQGTRSAMAWRKAAAGGDTDVIRQLLDDAIASWRSMKRPKEVPPEVWRGVQSVELVDVGPDSGRVSCQVESEYRTLGGRSVEVARPLQQGMAVTVRLADMLLYEVANLQLASVRVDAYTTFRSPEEGSRRACILTTTAGREAAREVDWENWTPGEIVDAFGGRYQLDDRGEALPLELERDVDSQLPPELGLRLER